MTNALVEIGLILISVILGLLGLPYIVIAVMVAISLVWWGFVHHIRFGTILRDDRAKAVMTLAMAAFAIILGHGIGFLLGGTFGMILGLK